MGNCLEHPSSVSWDGEEWDFADLDEPNDRRRCRNYKRSRDEEDERLLENKNGGSFTEVRIRVTKKELAEFIGKGRLEGMSIEQTIKELVNMNSSFELRHRHWRPALQSIPEVD